MTRRIFALMPSGVMERRITREILDDLDGNHPDAVASRQDLHVLNHLMGNYRWFEQQVRAHAPENAHYIEIGAGNARLARRIANTVPVGSYRAIDRTSAPSDWPDAFCWQQCDIRSLRDFGSANVFLANLILHHFENRELRELGAMLDGSSIRVLLINEPARRRRHLWQLKLSPLLRFNAVTRHDSQASVRAGFLHNELTEALGLNPAQWRFHTTTGLLGACRLCALRR